jgi:hypothetical protein
VSALLGAAIAAFLLWPRAGPSWRLAVETRSAGAPMTAPAGGLRLIAGLPSAVVGKGADQLNLPPSLTNVATELSRGSVLIVTSIRRAPVHLDEAVNAAPIGPSAPEGGQPPAPNVTAPPLAAPVGPPYVRSPGKSYAYTGRYRVEEDKFSEVPCTVTRIASSAGGQCLRGYRGLGCDKAIDVVTFTVANLSIEASVLIFDPYKLTATASASRCYIAGHPGYDQEDFQDMNQVTRRGTNWHNLVIDEQDRQNRSIEFSERGHACVAVLRHGPVWRGGYVWTLHASICRTDAAPVQAQDVAYVLGSLQTRIYDPVGNLRSPDDWTTYGPPAR